MYTEIEWPNDFVMSIMNPFEKKKNAVECGDHRTISLIPHASKIMLKVLKNRIEKKAEEYIGRTQFGFRKGCGTREAIAVVRLLCERSIEHGNETFLCFIDFEKAFDMVNWKKMMNILKRIGIDRNDRKLISELYRKQRV